MLNILFAASAADWSDYKNVLPAEFARLGLQVNLVCQTEHPETIDYIIYAPSSALQDFSPFASVKAVLSLWAGVEGIVNNKTLTQTLCRLVDPGLAEGMREWVSGHVLRYHLGMDAHVQNQIGIWRADSFAPLARDRSVGILGLGELGHSCAIALKALGFQVHGWSRTQKVIPGIECHFGDTGLNYTLERAEILVLLLPETKATKQIVNTDTCALMPKGVKIINAGRGALIDDDALLNALSTSQISHATLDVFNIEPLPEDHPYWHHPKVTVTPHIASATRPQSAAATIANNVMRGETGEPFLHVVNPSRGY